MKIAYLGPEIPALSATFVYQEIAALADQGYDIVPISVHHPGHVAQGEAAAKIAARTVYLYDEGLGSFAKAALSLAVTAPGRFASVLMQTVGDSLCPGLSGHVRRGLLYRFLAGARVAEILKAEQCRHIHAHFAHIPTDITMYGAALAGIPFTFTSHANDLFERGWLLKEKVARSKYAVTISDFNWRFLVSKGADERKIRIVRCGVESERYAPLARVDACRRGDGPFVIGALGRLVEKKGMDVLIRASALLARQGRSLRVEIAGDGPLMEELKSQAKAEGVSASIQFRGALPHTEVFPWLGTLDLFALACKKDKNGDMDGIPVVLMEAMALGVPAVSTEISAIPELVEDGVSGLIARPGDPESLAEKIAVIMDHPDRVTMFMKNGRKRVAEEFSTGVNISRLRSLFEGV
jgi:glycosyltransferase involved in cell wall biosynthesis